MEDDSKQYRSLLAWFEAKAYATPQQELQTQDGSHIRYQTLNEHSSLLAGWMQTRARLGRSARIAVWMPDTAAYAVAVCATWRIGGCLVDLPPDTQPQDLPRYCQEAEIEALLVAHAQFVSIKDITTVVSKPGDYRHWWQNIGKRRPTDSIWLSRALLEGRGLPYVRPEIHPVEAASVHFDGKKWQRTNHQAVLAGQLPEAYSPQLKSFLQRF